MAINNMGAAGTRHPAHEHHLAKRIEDIGWGVLLIMTGSLWLVPAERVPHGSWLIGAGLVLLIFNGIRYAYGITVSLFTTLLGVVVFAAGLANYFGAALPVPALALIMLGVVIIAKHTFTRSIE